MLDLSPLLQLCDLLAYHCHSSALESCSRRRKRKISAFRPCFKYQARSILGWRLYLPCSSCEGRRSRSKASQQRAACRLWQSQQRIRGCFSLYTPPQGYRRKIRVRGQDRIRSDFCLKDNFDKIFMKWNDNF